MTHDRTRPPLPPMVLSATAQTGLIALRVFLGVITVMAIFTFIHGLPG
ncbi:MAG TPA: hypothetical protein VKP60_06015 [Magnetospirillaceae bacterium]|nr:hypothetical protein [Magnetospirillaceae bacterium]